MNSMNRSTNPKIPNSLVLYKCDVLIVKKKKEGKNWKVEDNVKAGGALAPQQIL